MRQHFAMLFLNDLDLVDKILIDWQSKLININTLMFTNSYRGLKS